MFPWNSQRKGEGWLNYEDHSTWLTKAFWATACCLCRVLSSINSDLVLSHTNYSPSTASTNSGLVLSHTKYRIVTTYTQSGLVLPAPIMAMVLSASILTWCSLHPYWPGTFHTHWGLVLSAPIMAQCCLQLSWPGAVRTNSGPVLPAPILTWCSPHLCLLSEIDT